MNSGKEPGHGRRVIGLTGCDLSIQDVLDVSLGEDGVFPLVELAPDVRERMGQARAELEQMVENGDVIYGVNTGCGSRKGEVIPTPELIDYQRYYAMAHACGLGEDLPLHNVRAMMLLRVNSFAKGNSAVTLGLCDKILELLNNNWIPAVPEAGSVGASGDLIPLAHLGTVLIGVPEAPVYVHGVSISTAELIEKHGYEPHVLQLKEAMGLTNGATMILARAIFALNRATRMFYSANVSAALCLEAVRGELDAFDPRIHEARDHEGQMMVASDILELVDGSRRTTREAQATPVCAPDNVNLETYTKPRIQDLYSLRGVPQAHGAVMQALNHLQETLEAEINASTDNPLIFADEEGRWDSFSGANFHGDPLAIPIEGVKVAMAKLARISNDRFYALLQERYSFGLPGDLTGSNKNGQTGLMISQYGAASDAAATAAMTLPATVLSIPTSSGQEDYVSMASISVWQLELLLERLSFALAREIHANCQAISLGEERLGEHAELGRGTGRAYSIVREHFPVMVEDRFFVLDLRKVLELLNDGAFDYPLW